VSPVDRLTPAKKAETVHGESISHGFGAYFEIRGTNVARTYLGQRRTHSELLVRAISSSLMSVLSMRPDEDEDRDSGGLFWSADIREGRLIVLPP
jgi:hypothetical protein